MDTQTVRRRPGRPPSRKPTGHPLNVQLSESVEEALRLYVAERNRSLGEVVIAALVLFLAIERAGSEEVKAALRLLADGGEAA